MPTITLQAEVMADIVDEIKPLHVAHWNELPDLRPPGELNPDYPRFFALQAAGSAILVTMRRDGVLVGYCSFYINACLWTGQRYATGDLLYLAPEARGLASAVRLYEYGHAVLKHVGITDVRGCANKTNRISSLMRYVGYRPTGQQQFARTL